MLTLRSKALEIVQSRGTVAIQKPSEKVSDFFAKNVFTDTSMQAFLSKEAYEAVTDAIHKGQKIDRAIANQVASGMKNWAMTMGVTHYTHWFQPLTGATILHTGFNL